MGESKRTLENQESKSNSPKNVSVDLAIQIKQLFEAIENKNIELLEQLTKDTKYINFFGEKWEGLITPLGLAIKTGNLEVVQLFIGKEVDLNKPCHILSNHVKSMSEERSEEKKLEILNKYASSPIDLALENKQIDIAKLLINEGVALNYDTVDAEFSPLEWAAHNNKPEIIECLFNQTKDLSKLSDDWGYWALETAVTHGYYEVVRLLLEAGAPVGATMAEDVPLLSLAAQYGHLEVVKLLLKKGANLFPLDDENGERWALVSAAQYGHLEVVRFLIECRADVNKTGPNEGTALYFAVKNGHLETAKLLLKHGASIKTEDGDDPLLCMAAENGDLEIAKVLLEYGANINEIDPSGDTALDLAVKKDLSEIIKFLIGNGAAIIDNSMFEDGTDGYTHITDDNSAYHQERDLAGDGKGDEN